jgi:hypothetical protein
LKTVLRIYNNKPLKFAEDIHPTFRLRGSFEQNIVNIVAFSFRNPYINRFANHFKIHS